MKLFLDSANVDEIKEALWRGAARGVTTNPSLVAKEPGRPYVEHLREVASVVPDGAPLSVEVVTAEPREMIEQARQIARNLEYRSGLAVKIPIGWGELEAVRDLSLAGIAVNATCLFTEAQAVLAANAGARYVSIFWGRLRDVGGDPAAVVRNTRAILDRAGWLAEIIVGSIRHERDVVDAMLAGAHIVTAGLPLLRKMAAHPQTEKSVEGFLADFARWQR